MIGPAEPHEQNAARKRFHKVFPDVLGYPFFQQQPEKGADDHRAGINEGSKHCISSYLQVKNSILRTVA
jgi:hypothetical protein